MTELKQQRMIILIALSIYAAVLGTPIVLKGYMYTGRNTVFADSYIKEIKTPSYGNGFTQWCLESFDKLTPGTAVDFNEKGNFREITIDEKENFLVPGTLGVALTLPTFCHIYMRKGLDYKSYCDILIHEYLHCMGYPHTSDRLDIMYPYYYKDADVLNKREYAIELAYIRERWKNLKNSNLSTTPTK